MRRTVEVRVIQPEQPVNGKKSARKRSRRDFLGDGILMLGGALLLTACAPSIPNLSSGPGVTESGPATESPPKSQTELEQRIIGGLQDTADGSTYIDLPKSTRDALRGITNPVTKIERPEIEFERVRVLNIPTTADLIKRAKDRGFSYTMRESSAMVEGQVLATLAAQPVEVRAQLFEAYAQAVVDGLTTTYTPDDKRIIVLEPGHMSNPDQAEVATLDNSRKRVGLAPLKVSQDEGATPAALPEGGTLTERRANYLVAALVAKKIATHYPNWIPLLTSTPDGYTIGRFVHKLNGLDFDNGDALFPLLWAVEQVVSAGLSTSDQVNKGGVAIPVTRMSLHHNSGTADTNAGMVITTNWGPVAQEDQALARNTANALQIRIGAVRSGYKSKIDTTNNTPDDPFLDLDYNPWPTNRLGQRATQLRQG